MTEIALRDVGGTDEAEDRMISAFGAGFTARAPEPRSKRKREYARYLRSSHWRRLRVRVLKRDRWRCRDCNSRRHLSVHHLTYERLGCEQLSDLITLCRTCHHERHFTEQATANRGVRGESRSRPITATGGASESDRSVATPEVDPDASDCIAVGGGT